MRLDGADVIVGIMLACAVSAWAKQNHHPAWLCACYGIAVAGCVLVLGMRLRRGP